MCPKDQFEEWYKHDRLMGTCELYGLDLLPLCPYENNPYHDFEDNDSILIGGDTKWLLETT